MLTSYSTYFDSAASGGANKIKYSDFLIAFRSLFFTQNPYLLSLFCTALSCILSSTLKESVSMKMAFVLKSSLSVITSRLGIVLFAYL